jgi:hypothetical protein
VKAPGKKDKKGKQDLAEEGPGEEGEGLGKEAPGKKGKKQGLGKKEAARVRTMECTVMKAMYEEGGIPLPYWHLKDTNPEDDPHAHGAHLCLTKVSVK